MDNTLIDAARKLAGKLGVAVGAGKDKLIVYITNDRIPDFIPMSYEGFDVEVKSIGLVRPC